MGQYRPVAQGDDEHVRSRKRATAPAIPAPLTSLVGRARELEAVADALRISRLVTLTGPGGVGKTRLALELGARRARQPGRDVSLVDLAFVGTADDMEAESARALGLRGMGRATTTDALRRLFGDRDVLLILDNCEHVVDACAVLVSRLLAGCPNLRILATSREPLSLVGEKVWRLEPLSAEDAYRLFADRAREQRPALVPDRDMDDVIVDICRRLDNLPLAIELAAARVRLMSPQEIAESLGVHVGAVGSKPRSRPEHHRSIRAVLDWSYDLLGPLEQTAFRALAVFVGSFDADAACAVGPMSLDMLARLIDKSLAAVIPAGPSHTRYRLLETVRDYAAEQLLAAGEEAEARSRHFQHFSTVGIPAEEGWMPARVVTWLDERAADYGNVRAAVDWAASSDPCAGMRLLANTKDLFFMLGQSDGRRLATAVLQACPERNATRADVHIAAGHFAFLVGDTDQATGDLTRAIALSVELGDKAREGAAHWFLGLHALFQGAVEEARERLATARRIQHGVADVLGEARTTAALGLTHFLRGDLGNAQTLLEEALTLGVAGGDRWTQGQANLYLGIVALSSGDQQAAMSSFRRSVECLRSYPDSTLLPMALIGQAGVVAKRDPARALKIVAAASSVRARNGGEFAPFYRAFAEDVRAVATKGAGGDAERLWKEGSKLSVGDAIALASGSRPRRMAPVPLLTARELDVVRLVAEGISNKEVAASLHLSERTVESHVRNALAKTGLTNRTQLATWARQHDPS